MISVSALSLGITGSVLLGLKTKSDVYSIAVRYAGGVVIAIPGLAYRWYHRIRAEKIKEITEELPQAFTSSAHCMDGFLAAYSEIEVKENLCWKNKKAKHVSCKGNTPHPFKLSIEE